MKSVVKLWVACLLEAGDSCCVRIHRDLAYAESRIEEEGLSFLTITLPAFEKDFITGLSRGYLGSDLFCGFRHRGGLPAFLSGFLRRIFDVDGSVLSTPDIGCIRALRQVLLLVSKIEMPTSPNREAKALMAYVETDQKLEEVPADLLQDFKTVSGRLLRPFLRDVERRLLSGDWLPRHSSGSLATRESYNSRWSNTTWTERLQEFLPFWEDLVVSPRHLIDEVDSIKVLARDEEPPVRVALVPKTMKSPRIIAMEPCWMQFVQQGILSVMTEVLHEKTYEPLAQIFSWLDQEPNRLLSRRGSIDGSFATIDLSEASDRVSLQLVEGLLDCAPFLKGCVMASRSETAVLPDGQTILLNKFASMGSSLCFPIESMVFFVIEALAVCEDRCIVPSTVRISDLPEMRVFGDDLIVPDSVARILMKLIEAYGLKVNTRKSFTTGRFRESCGSDWYSGADVSVFKLRSAPPSLEHHLEALDRAISFQQRAFGAGWYAVAGMMEYLLLGVFPHIPRVPEGVPGSAFWTDGTGVKTRTNSSLHRLEYKALVFRQVKPVDPLDGFGALRKCLSPHGLLPRDKDHLKRDGRSRYAGMHIGWIGA